MSPSTDNMNLSEEEWRKKLSPEQFRVCREKGTERAFTGKYWNSKKHGMYTCVACGYVEWWCEEPSEIPIGPEYMSELVDYTPDAPFR